MKTYDQIIFEELVQHRPVLLHEVGYLTVETIPSQIRDGRSVSAPRNVVAFASEAPQNARNVVDILTESGIDNQTAWDQYNQWLALARKDGKLVMDGVGTLNNMIFIPAPEMDRALNPNSPGILPVRRRSNSWIWILVSIAILAALLMMGLRYCSGDSASEQRRKPTQSTAQQPAHKAQPAATETEASPTAQQETPAATPVPVTTAQSGLGYPVAGRHYVVGGVFDIPSNADKYISYIKRTFPDLTPEKFSYPGIRPGRTMVTVYSSTNRNEAHNIRRQMAWNYGMYEYWLFPEEK